MATPHKTTIAANVQALLEGITIAGGYRTDVETVENIIRDWQQVAEPLRPWIGFKWGLGRERFTLQGPGHMWVEAPMYIGAHVHGSTEAAVNINIVNLQDDIIAAMYEDPTLSETVVDVRLIDGMDDIGDPDRGIGGGDKGFSGTFDQQWEITYERTTGST